MQDLTPPANRIEHDREGYARLILGFCDHARRPQMTLMPYADPLLAQGETGQLELIDQVTGAVIACRHLVRFWPD